MLRRVRIDSPTAESLVTPSSARRVSITIMNLGPGDAEVYEGAKGHLGEGFPLIPGAEYDTISAGSTALWGGILNPEVPATLAVSVTVVERDVAAWVFKGPVDDFTLGRLPFAESQAQLRGPAETRSAKLATAEWHGAGPEGDPERVSFAMVDEEGPLANLVGERVLVRHGTKQVYAYVHRSAALGSEISVTRRLFMALAPLATTQLPVVVSVVK